MNWISVEERLPEIHVSVLTCYATAVPPFMEVDYRCEHSGGDFWWYEQDAKVTHWMPLPPPPTTGIEVVEGEHIDLDVRRKS